MEEAELLIMSYDDSFVTLQNQPDGIEIISSKDTIGPIVGGMDSYYETLTQGLEEFVSSKNKTIIGGNQDTSAQILTFDYEDYDDGEESQDEIDEEYSGKYDLEHDRKKTTEDKVIGGGILGEMMKESDRSNGIGAMDELELENSMRDDMEKSQLNSESVEEAPDDVINIIGDLH